MDYDGGSDSSVQSDGMMNRTRSAAASRTSDVALSLESYSVGDGIELRLNSRFGSLIDRDVKLTVTVLDGGLETRSQLVAEQVRPGRHNSTQVSLTIQRPGYYRIIATAHSLGPMPDSLASRRFTRSSSAMLWLLVDSAGVTLTDGYQPESAGVRRRQYGPYGPFVDLVRKRRVESGTQELSSVSATTSLPFQVNGTYEYFDQTQSPLYVNDYVPVRGGRVVGTCYGRSSEQVLTQDVEYGVATYVDSEGTWSIECPEGVAYAWDYALGNIYPDGYYADVRNHLNTSVASGWNGVDGDTLTIHAASDYQAHVLSTIQTYAPVIHSEFDRSRSKIRVKVHDTDSTFSVHYEPTADYIQTHFGLVFGQSGVFATLHEYAHAFHWVALEAPDQYSCSGGGHAIGEANNVSCAFVEGFADFVPGFVAADWFTSGHPGADANMEVQSYGTSNSVDGWRIEGAVAGFFYDLVDDASTPDAPWSGVDDDGASYTLAEIGDIIVSCSLNGGSAIHGVDMFIYCAEQSLAAQSLTHPSTGEYYFGRTFPFFSVSVDSHALSATIVRDVWLDNLFKQ